MKTCGYCGQSSPDEAACCVGCGTGFQKAAGGADVGFQKRPPRPEAASVVLRTFTNEAAAHQSVELLRNARIEGFIATDDCGGLYPPLNAGSPFRLVVSEVHREAAELVLAGIENKAEPAMARAAYVDLTEPPAFGKPPSTLRSLVVFVLGILAGALILAGYQSSRGVFSGTVQRDFNHDGRTDGWETYQNGKFSKTAADRNGNEQPDAWHYLEDDVMTKWEEDWNFDGRIDFWGAYDSRGVPSQSKMDVDFDGKPDVNFTYEFGLAKESHWIQPDSGLVWKKDFYTNGILREQLLDRDRDGKFDEKLSFDVYGVEMKKEKLE